MSPDDDVDHTLLNQLSWNIVSEIQENLACVQQLSKEMSHKLLGIARREESDKFTSSKTEAPSEFPFNAALVFEPTKETCRRVMNAKPLTMSVLSKTKPPVRTVHLPTKRPAGVGRKKRRNVPLPATTKKHKFVSTLPPIDETED